MSNTRWKYGTQVTVLSKIGSGDDLADAAFSPASDTYGPGATRESNDYEYADFVLELEAGFNATTNLKASSQVHLYARAIDTEGSNDAPVPDANFRHTYVCSFSIDPAPGAAGDAQWLSRNKVPIPHKIQEFYLENDTGQQIEANGTLGYKLHVTPVSLEAV